jgi:hypothetical protein
VRYEFRAQRRIERVPTSASRIASRVIADVVRGQVRGEHRRGQHDALRATAKPSDDSRDSVRRLGAHGGVVT